MNDGRELTVEYTLKPADIYSPLRWERNNVARWVIAALFCYFLYEVLTRSADTLRSFDGGGSVLAIVVLLFVLILFGLLLFPYLRGVEVFRSTPAFSSPTRVTFRPDSILSEVSEARSECKWALFTGAFEPRQVFVFSQGKAGGTYIPNRAFRSSEDVAFLRQLIRENIKGKITLRRD